MELRNVNYNNYYCNKRNGKSWIITVFRRAKKYFFKQKKFIKNHQKPTKEKK